MTSQTNQINFERELSIIERRVAILEVKMDAIRDDVSTIKADLKKILWIMIAGFAGAFVTYVVNGGIASVPI